MLEQGILAREKECFKLPLLPKTAYCKAEPWVLDKYSWVFEKYY